MKGISVKGVTIAALVVLAVDIVGGLIIGVALVIINRQSESALSNTQIMILGILLADFSIILGGYVAARIAKVCYYKNAAVFGGIGFIIGIITSSQYPLWFNVSFLLSVFPAALLGGHLAKSFGKKINTATR